VTRARLAVVALVITVAGITPGVSRAAKFRYTHRVSVSGRLTDHWTVDDPQACGPVGGGTVTLRFQSKRTTRAKVVIDRAKNGAGNKLGSWALLAPQGRFHKITDIKSKPATATVVLVDNTTLRPPPTGDCAPADKSGCGTRTLAGARSSVGGYDRRRVFADLVAVDEFNRTSAGRTTACQIGGVGFFDSPPKLVGGSRTGAVLVKMPSARTLARKRVVKVSATVHKQTTTPGDPGSASYTDDVTRTVTVTFTRL
jgi:hypothetical protein